MLFHGIILTPQPYFIHHNHELPLGLDSVMDSAESENFKNFVTGHDGLRRIGQYQHRLLVTQLQLCALFAFIGVSIYLCAVCAARFVLTVK